MRAIRLRLTQNMSTVGELDMWQLARFLPRYLTSVPHPGENCKRACC